jgi:hypothetical protein
MQTRPFALVTATLLGLAAFAAPAATIDITNPGFESPAVDPNAFNFNAPPGWQGFNRDAVNGDFIGVLNPSTSTYFTAGQWQGNNVGLVYIEAARAAGTAFGLRQVLSAGLAADTLYTLSVDVGNIASGSSVIGGNNRTFDLDGFPGYRIELLAGDNLLAADDNSLADTLPEGQFLTSQLAFDSTGVDNSWLGLPLEIRLLNLNQIDPDHTGADREVDFDAVQLDAVNRVPAPAPIWLLPTAGLALLLRQRR